jgi:starch synthase
MLLHAHNGEPGGRMWHLMVRVLLRCGLTVVVPSRQGARTWARAQAARVIELANSVDDRATRVEGPEPTVVTVARLHPDKGLDVLLEAVALLHIRGTALRVLVIGPDASGHDMLAQSLRSRAATLPGVEVRGVVFDPSTLLADAWVYVQPSRREPFGLAALEASASGLPVVASRVGGLPDIVEDEVTGLLVDPGQVSALADALERLIGNADERDRLGRAGADRARTKFGPDVFAERVGALYARVAR